MAQLKAVSPYSCPNLAPYGRKTEQLMHHQFWKTKPSSFKEFGRRTSVGVSKPQVIRAVLQSDTEKGISESKKGSVLRGKLEKVVLAYSGGLDTSVIVPWLRENYGCDVVCFTADVGQGIKELEGLGEKAKASGTSQLMVW